jgi:ABC-type Na+ efflux pump permease subunit
MVLRELVAAARRPAAHRGRVIAFGCAILVGGFALEANLRLPAAKLGHNLFWTLAASLSFYCLLNGMRLTLDCLSSEKRDQTLGLLFLTDLNGYDVVFGKLAATSLNSIYQILSVFPLLAFPFLLGALDLPTFLIFALSVGATLLFSMSAGMWASSFCVEERRASALAGVVVLAFCSAGPSLGWMVAATARWKMDTQWWGVSPACYCYGAVAEFFGGGAVVPTRADYWRSLVLTLFYSCVLLAIACHRAPRWANQDDPGAGRGRGWRWPALITGAPAAKLVRRRKLLEKNPALWLGARRTQGNPGVWLALLLIAAGFWAAKPRYRAREAEYWAVWAFFSQLVVKIGLASHAAGILANDRRSGAVELLLTTPLSAKEIIRAEMATLRRLYAGPVAALALAEVCLFLVLAPGFNGRIDRIWLQVFVVNALALGADLYSLSWIGMEQALARRNAARGAAVSVGIVLAAPWVVFTLVSYVAPLVENYSLNSIYAVTAASILASMIVASRAKRRLGENLRVLAIEGDEAARPTPVASDAWLSIRTVK